MYVVLSALLFALVVGALIDIILSEQSRIKHLPKFLWIVIVILTPLIGSILWFAIGRVYESRSAGHGGFGAPRPRARSAPSDGGLLPHNSLPGGSALGYPGRDDSGLSKTERELAALEREIAASEKEARIRQLEEELRARRETENPGD
jgi:hypothetical protein